MVRDGYIYGLSLFAVAVALVWFTGAWVWGIVPVLLALFFLWFFRDPEREIPAGDGLIVSPGDGLVTETVAISTPEGPRQRISIFLSVFDVHVNRTPVGGVVTRVHYQKGLYLNAMRLPVCWRAASSSITRKAKRSSVASASDSSNLVQGLTSLFRRKPRSGSKSASGSRAASACWRPCPEVTAVESSPSL